MAGKTGWTPNAGSCLCEIYSHEGINLSVVIAQSQDRFDDMVKLIKYAVKKIKVQKADQALSSLPEVKGRRSILLSTPTNKLDFLPTSVSGSYEHMGLLFPAIAN